MYGHVNISGLKWEFVSHPATKLCAANLNPQYRGWYESVGNRVERFASDGWNCIDIRSSVIEHWSKYGTWETPPIFLFGELINSSSDLHLAEGHTRLGLLAGLTKHHILPPGSIHQAWLGSNHESR